MSVKQKLPAKASSQEPDPVDQWFSDLIDQLNVDHLLIKEKVAPKEKIDLYNKLIFGEHVDLMSNSRHLSTRFFLSKLIVEYVQELKNLNKMPLKLALGLSDSKIMVWAEIEDGDESAEDALFLAEAKVNSDFHPKGFFINSTIVEKSDNLPVPPHYQPLI